MGVNPKRPTAEDADSRTWAESSIQPGRGSAGDPPPSAVDVQTPPPAGPVAPESSTDSGHRRPPSGGSDPGHTPSGDNSGWDQSPPPILGEGEVVFERFQLLKHLGGGGMGDVWLVRNVEMDRKRALKLIKPGLARNDRGWKRFKREAQLMAKLEHPNAVRVFGYHRSQSMGCIEMEFVAGRSLDKVLKDQPGSPRPLGWIVPILDQLCAVLHEAHTHRDEDTGKPKPIIHRDLKPSNLMLVADRPPGQDLKVLDFGIAKMIDEEETQEEHLTGHDDFLGTASYCSPEQLIGVGGARAEVDARSDLYSVGVILYEFLTGVLPFRGSSYAVLAARLNGEPPPMARSNPAAKVPAGVERLVLQCLAKDPAGRPRDALELARRFRAAATPETGPVSWTPVRAAIAGSALLVGALVISAIWSRMPKGDGARVVGAIPDKINVFPPADIDSTKREHVVKAPPAIWEPEGYRAVDPAGPVEGRRREPGRLRRVVDGIEFRRLGEGVYIPADYEPEDDNLSGGWPAAIIRSVDRDKKTEDRIRLIRVAGKTYERGDVREGNPNPNCTRHWVSVGPFYIQETEATNGQVGEYLEVFGADRQSTLGAWKAAYQNLRQENPRDAVRYPAVAVDYRMARRIARYFQGRLPTEAEWELVGKSGVDDYKWAWGSQDPPRKTPWASLFNQNRVGQGPNVSGHFPKDRTQQGVFDMTGNVREWCLDGFRPSGEIIPQGNSRDNPLLDRPGDGFLSPEKIDPSRNFVVKGGSFLLDPDESMVFLRSMQAADEEINDLGFRIVIDCPAPTVDR